VDAQANALQLEQAQQGRADNAANFSELLQQSKEARLRTEEGFDNLRREETQRQKQYVLKWLSAADAMSDQDHHRDCRKISDSGQWLLQNKRFRAWHDTDSLSAPLLWVTGIPGAGNYLVQNAPRLQELTLHAGKSVLASVIFDQSSKLPNTTPVIFFCKGDDLEKNTFVGMARSILHQLLLGEETLLQYLFQAATTEGETQLRTTKLARELLNTCLRAVGRVYAVIDGIDECQQIEQQHIVKFWITYVEHASSDLEPSKCTLLSRDDISTKQMFTGLPIIRVQGKDHESDIRSYTISRTAALQQKFRLTDAEKEDIASRTASRAKDMFLFARLVMDNLSNQVNKAGIFIETAPEVFPVAIDDLYVSSSYRAYIYADRS
jgi:hypothetical protein